MKKIKIILIAVLVFILAVFFLNKPIISFFAKQAISKVFIGSRVSIGKCVFNPVGGIAFYDLKVKHQDYDFTIKQLKIDYLLRELYGGRVSRVFLEDILVDIHAKDKNVQSLINGFKAGPSKGFIADRLELPGAKIKIKALDLSAEADLSCILDLKKQSLSAFALKVGFLQMPNLNLSGLTLKDISVGKVYNLNIGRMEYKTVKLNNIYGKIRLNGNRIIISPLFGNMAGGKIFVNAEFVWDKTVIYSINIEAQDLNAQNLVDEFRLKEKIEMTGRLSGRASLQGGGYEVYVLSANLSFLAPGGTLVIKDEEMLENIAGRSEQPLDIVMEGFKDYKYDTGTCTLSLGGHDLGMVMLLEGKAGRRSLNITWHDFDVFKPIM